MISVTHFQARDAEFATRGQDALAALAQRPGYLRGSLARSTDDDHRWVLITEWENVGTYRRALGNYDVKIRATTLLAEAIDLPSSFEVLVEAAAGGETTVYASDREPNR
jgi:heme oxygenase (mycobilin-producing)